MASVGKKKMRESEKEKESAEKAKESKNTDEKHEVWRQKFMTNLKKAGIQMEEVRYIMYTFT